MPILDFECQCGAQLLDQYIHDYRSRPVCPDDSFIMDRLWTDAHRPFTSFEVDIDGKVMSFTSLHQVREFEAASERKYAEKRGAPYIFRKLSQDSSNYDVNVFGRFPADPILPPLDLD